MEANSPPLIPATSTGPPVSGSLSMWRSADGTRVAKGAINNRQGRHQQVELRPPPTTDNGFANTNDSVLGLHGHQCASSFANQR